MSDSAAVLAGNWLDLVKKNKFSLFFIGIAIFLLLDGAVQVNLSGKGVAIGPIVTAEVRSILTLAAGCSLVLGAHQMFVGTSVRPKKFENIVLGILLFGVTVFSFLPLLNQYIFHSIIVVSNHGIENGTYFVELSAPAQNKFSGSYLVLAARKQNNQIPCEQDDNIKFSDPFRIDRSDDLKRFEIEIVPERDWKVELKPGKNFFDCRVIIVPPRAKSEIGIAKTIEELEALGGVQERKLTFSVSYDLPKIVELERTDFLESLGQKELDRLKSILTGI